MPVSGRESLPDDGSGREPSTDVVEWSRGPFECPLVGGKPSQMSVSGREAFPDVRE